MPHHASAKKRIKTNARDRARNKSVKSHIRRANQSLDKAMSGEGAEADAALREAHSVLDKAAKKGVIPKNRANRKKARLARAVHKAQASS